MAFSPNERYLVTHSLVEPATPQDKATMVLNLFDVRLGRCLRNFTGPADEFAVGAAAGAWPIFKWAGHADDKCAPALGVRMPHDGERNPVRVCRKGCSVRLWGCRELAEARAGLCGLLTSCA